MDEDLKITPQDLANANNDLHDAISQPITLEDLAAAIAAVSFTYEIPTSQLAGYIIDSYLA